MLTRWSPCVQRTVHARVPSPSEIMGNGGAVEHARATRIVATSFERKREAWEASKGRSGVVSWSLGGIAMWSGDDSCGVANGSSRGRYCKLPVMV